ncbi:MAG: hypothetical protein U0359_15000 [Byssovorax sp.]
MPFGLGPSAPGPSPAEDDGSTPNEPGVVRMHIQPRGFDLRGAASCPAPCGKVIDGRGGVQFFFAGQKVPESARFSLGTATGDVTATVRPGKSFTRNTGYVLVGISGYLVISSVQSMLVGLIVNEVTHDRTYVDPWYMSAGLNITMAVGLIGAGLTFVERGATTFQLLPGKPQTR